MPATLAKAEVTMTPDGKRFSVRTEQMWAETESIIAATLKDLDELKT
jgi:hypothetical protein